MKFVRYLKIDNSELIHAGQDPKTKEWYCKDLPARTTTELRRLMGEINAILNEYNFEEKEKKEG